MTSQNKATTSYFLARFALALFLVVCATDVQGQASKTRARGARLFHHLDAKAAWARLTTYLIAQGSEPPANIYELRLGDRQITAQGNNLLAMPSGWVITFRTKGGRWRSANVASSGKVVMGPDAPRPFRPIPVDDWKFDSYEAHLAALNVGGYSRSMPGRAADLDMQLAVRTVEGIGDRLLWCGLWTRTDGVGLCVDATDGRYYVDEGNRWYPYAQPGRQAPGRWQPYDETSQQARRAQVMQQGVWYPPFAYEQRFSPTLALGRLVYNHDGIQRALSLLPPPAKRSDDELATHAALSAALGNWLQALESIRAAEALRPSSSHRFWEGLFLSAIRDLVPARKVAAALPPGNERETLQQWIDALQKPSTIALTVGLSTGLGTVPIQLYLGPVPIFVPGL